MGFFSNLFGGNKPDSDYMTTAHLIPGYFSSFPVYPKKIVEEPVVKETEGYNRLEIYYRGKPLQEYYDILKQNGFIQETDVRFNKGRNCYVIVERVNGKTKIAYHLGR